MSLGRIATRAAVVGLGVLASIVFMAAPSWAAKGGNSTNAKLCETESAALVAQNGNHFKNAGACTSYAAKGGQLAKLAVHVQFQSSCACVTGSASGFGLKPSTLYSLRVEAAGGQFAEGDGAVDESGVVIPGTSISFGCPVSDVSARAEATLASGVPIKAVTAETVSCP
jgi:hypothetical protein